MSSEVETSVDISSVASTSLGMTNGLSSERLPRPRLAEGGLSVER